MVFCLGDELDGLLPRVPNPRLNGQILCCLDSRVVVRQQADSGVQG